MFLVTGATGNVGSAVVSALLAAGAPVRGVVRDPAAARLPAGATAVRGDLNDAASFETAAFDGVHGLFLMPGYDGAAEVLRLARAAGVERVVQLSGASAATRDMGNAVTAYMVRAEDLATASGLEWTIVRPHAFMSNALRWLPQLAAGDTVRLPFAGVRASVIDPADIGAVAAAALTTDSHAGNIYRVTGPQSLLPEEQVAILGQALGRSLTFDAQSNDEAREEMSSQMPSYYVDAFFDFYVDGSLDESPVFPTVEHVTGRAPGTFEAWTRAHAGEFP